MKIPGLNFSKGRWKSGFEHLRLGLSPESDWKIIFFSTSIIAFLIAILTAAIFLFLNKREILTTNQAIENGMKTLDVSALRDTVSYYQAKAVEFEKIKKGGGSLIVDPSL